MKKAGMYTRVSTGKQKEKYSLPAQEAMLREYAEQHDFDVVEHYQDAGISAKDTNRPDFQRLMRDCEEGKLDVVLAVEMDRTLRSVEDMFALDKFFREHGVEYRELDCEDTGIQTSDGFLKRTIKSTISQYERMHTAERVKRTMLHRAKQGKFHGGTPPFGFTSRGTLVKELQKRGMTESEALKEAVERCPEGGRLYPISDEVKVVKFIFNIFLTTNSLRKTAYDLNTTGYRTHIGGLWSAESIRRVLKHPAYLGMMTYGKTAMEDGQRVRKAEEEWIIAKAQHKPIISQDQFDAVQALLASHQKPRRTGRIYLLSGLVKCGLCGGAMVGWSRMKRGKRYCYYRCSRKELHGDTACQGLRWRAEKLETFIIEEMLKLATNEEFLTDTQKHIEEIRTLLNTQSITQDVDQIDRELRQNQRRLDRILDAYENGDIDRTDFKRRYQELKERVTTLEDTKEKLTEQADKQYSSFVHMQESFEEILSFGYNWENLSDTGKQQRLQAVIHEMRVTRDHVDVDLIVEGWELSHLDYRLPGWA